MRQKMKERIVNYIPEDLYNCFAIYYFYFKIKVGILLKLKLV